MPHISMHLLRKPKKSRIFGRNNHKKKCIFLEGLIRVRSYQTTANVNQNQPIGMIPRQQIQPIGMMPTSTQHQYHVNLKTTSFDHATQPLLKWKCY